MAIFKNTGDITATELQTFFQQPTGDFQLTDYYRGGGIVPATGTGSDIITPFGLFAPIGETETADNILGRIEEITPWSNQQFGLETCFDIFTTANLRTVPITSLANPDTPLDLTNGRVDIDMDILSQRNAGAVPLVLEIVAITPTGRVSLNTTIIDSIEVQNYQISVTDLSQLALASEYFMQFLFGDSNVAGNQGLSYRINSISISTNQTIPTATNQTALYSLTRSNGAGFNTEQGNFRFVYLDDASPSGNVLPLTSWPFTGQLHMGFFENIGLNERQNLATYLGLTDITATPQRVTNRDLIIRDSTGQATFSTFDISIQDFSFRSGTQTITRPSFYISVDATTGADFIGIPEAETSGQRMCILFTQPHSRASTEETFTRIYAPNDVFGLFTDRWNFRDGTTIGAGIVRPTAWPTTGNLFFRFDTNGLDMNDLAAALGLTSITTTSQAVADTNLIMIHEDAAGIGSVTYAISAIQASTDNDDVVTITTTNQLQSHGVPPSTNGTVTTFQFIRTTDVPQPINQDVPETGDITFTDFYGSDNGV